MRARDYGCQNASNRQLNDTMGNWVKLCSLLTLGLPRRSSRDPGLTLWGAIVAVLLLICPASIIGGFIALGRDGAIANCG